MQKTLKAFAVLSLTASLAACGIVSESGYGGTNNQYEPQGYFSNAKHGDDNDHREGPLTEWYDHSVGEEQKVIREEKARYLQNKDKNGHPQNPSKPLVKEDRNFFERDNKHPYSRDANYHGHQNVQNVQAKNSYYTNYNGKLAEKLVRKAEAVDGVLDAQTFIGEKEIIVGVQISKNSDAKAVKSEVKRTVARYAKGAKVKVSDDTGTFNYIRVLDNDLRDGGPIDLKNTRFTKDK